MNMKVKIAIAAAIVVGLIAIIVVDGATKKKEPQAPAPAPKETSLFPKRDGGKLLPDYNETGEKEIAGNKEKTDRVEPKKETPKTETTEKKTEPKPETTDAGYEDYVIQSGDTFEDIAERKYGDRSLWRTIADANPSVHPSKLTIGRKIRLPVKPAPKAQDDTAIQSDGGKRIYVVQAGDDLSKISKKAYNTTAHWKKIYDANRDQLSSPDEVQVGMKLVLPDVAPVRKEDAKPKTETEKEDGQFAGRKTHKVVQKDVLWNIAEKYRGDRGILEMIDAIVKANPDKLKNADTPLRLGWVLVIP